MIMAEKINKDMTFAEALQISGHKGAEIMTRWGLHCVGCPGAANETIEQGCAVHGLSESDAERMVDEINKALNKKE